MSAFPRWTQEEKHYLREAWGRAPLTEIVERLGRSEAAIRQEAYKLLGTTLDRQPLRRLRRRAHLYAFASSPAP
jgi:hypothetical protein